MKDMLDCEASEESKGISLSLPANLLAEMDEFARRNYMNRSTAFRLAASTLLQSVKSQRTEASNGPR